MLLRHIAQLDVIGRCRCMFVDSSLQPKGHVLQKGWMADLMGGEDMPTEEMFERAFIFRKKKLCRWCLE